MSDSSERLQKLSAAAGELGDVDYSPVVESLRAKMEANGVSMDSVPDNLPRRVNEAIIVYGAFLKLNERERAETVQNFILSDPSPTEVATFIEQHPLSPETEDAYLAQARLTIFGNPGSKPSKEGA